MEPEAWKITFDARLILAERELLALAGILECVGSDARVLRDHLAVGANFLHAGAIAGLELVDERDVHSADESDFLRVADQRRQCADEERAFLFAELERRDVRRRRNDVAFLVGRERVVDAGERRCSDIPSRDW